MTNREPQNASGLITTETGIQVLVFLCKHPYLAVGAPRLSALIDRDEDRVRDSLEALSHRGLAAVESAARGESLYRLAPVPAVWSLAKAHLDYAA